MKQKRKYSSPSISLLATRKDPSFVNLKDAIVSTDYKSKFLSVVLGRHAKGDIHSASLVELEHLLIAGASGTGKSIFLHSLITSLVYKYAPWELQFILVDPKRTEFALYKDLPHVLGGQILECSDSSINALEYLKSEIEKREDIIAGTKYKSVAEFNRAKTAAKEFDSKLPHIVFIVDELADIMLNEKTRIESLINSIAQKGAMYGIHLVLNTERTTADVLTGTIKASIGGRIAFWVESVADSRNIIDSAGAEVLSGHGNMLVALENFDEPIHVQGAYISMPEIRNIIVQIADKNDKEDDSDFIKAMNLISDKNQILAEIDHDDDPLLIDALKVCIQKNMASVKEIQRKFSLGYARSIAIMQQLEDKGYIGNIEEGVATVLMTQGQFCEQFNVDANEFCFGESENEKQQAKKSIAVSKTPKVITKELKSTIKENTVKPVSDSKQSNEAAGLDMPDSKQNDSKKAEKHLATHSSIQGAFQEISTEFEVNAKLKLIIVGNSAQHLTSQIWNERQKYLDFMFLDTDVLVDQNGSAASFRALKKGVSDHDFGIQAARLNLASLGDDIGDVAFIVANLGSGTGSSAVSVIAEYIKKSGVLTIAFAVMPYAFEGQQRLAMAEKDLQSLQDAADIVIKIDAAKIMANNKNVSIANALKPVEDVIKRVVYSLGDIISKPGLISPDFSSIYNALESKTNAHFGQGFAENIDDALSSAYSCELLGTTVAGASSVVLHIEGDASLPFSSVGESVEKLKIEAANAEVIVSLSINSNIKGVKVTIIAT